MTSIVLEDLGLSMNESKVYDSLLSYGGSGVSTIALRAKIHRSNAYDSLHRLIEKGLVYEVLGQRETIYEAVDPQKLRELLNEKMQKLDVALPAMLRTFHQNLKAERAYIFKGVEGVKNYMRLALKEGKDICTLGGNGAWLDPRIAPFAMSFMRDARKKKIQLKNIFNEEVAAKFPEALTSVSSSYKLLPHRYASNSAIDIFGDHIVTFTGMSAGKLSDDFTVFVLVSKPLAESFRKWWQYYWDTLPEPKRAKRKR